MVKIGNIVNYGQGSFTLDHFNVFKDINEIDNNLPTLLVGYSQTKEKYGELNFFDKKLDKDLFWTFGRVEDRYNYNKDLGNFIDYCEEQIDKGFDYLFINPFELTLNQFKRFLKYLKTDKGVVVLDGPMIYMWTHRKTFGFHMEFGEIFGVEREHMLRFLVQNKYSVLPEKEIKTIRSEFGELEIDLSRILFLRDKFAIL